jgi:hypothetical protein
MFGRLIDGFRVDTRGRNREWMFIANMRGFGTGL